ncbi:MetQ/NlpA family ABC transporter substrate-binding protein [Kocuria rhizophila]|uniref:MetQ/NlpA family ABC transporter substrate-binding protein n=1 Tax=Kocuria rhizophila TaxID=72000 RepID=UPI000C878DB1|nr:MetQ/NlpA family ABC transporter substrate-binding protein [Kocuria rhizophila]MCT1958543.1 MetQ/NlpA family ABC transporter substrate-binding protein [Kocuria rhizophila]MCT2073617.1 MetQ/NlpA family ABC transporter substrate-binding protein [Kocuria rhizophila]PMR91067.1 ABC transporter substrate-binding protein [Kocuria rhizophila]
MRSKRLIPVVLATTLGLTLTACGGPENTDPMADGKITIGIVGATPVQDALKDVAAQNDVTVEFVDFSDYSQPNPALKSGDIDMNWFQHIAYLADYNNNSGDTITPVGSTSIFPLGLYSKSVKSVADVKDGDEIAVPNDSINLSRALSLLEQQGLVTFTKDTIAPTEQDVDTEKSKVKVRPVSAEQTVLSMDSVAASVVNNDFLDRANLEPKNALAQDDPTADSAKVYDNLFAATEANADNETLKKVAGFYYDDKVQEAEKQETKGTAVPTKVEQQELKDLLSRYSEDLKGQSK